MSATRQKVKHTKESDMTEEAKTLQLMLSAVKTGNIQEVSRLVSQHRPHLDKPLAEGKTLLQTAVELNHAAIVIKLLEEKADANGVNKRKVSPLHYTARNTSHFIVTVLLEAKANPNVLDNAGRSPLYYATHANKPIIVEQLLKAKACPNLTTSTALPYTAPLHIAARRGYTEIVEALLENKADVNIKDKYQENHLTPLCYAASSGNIGIVKILLAYKADPNQHGSGGYAFVPMNHVSANNINHDAIKKLLLEYGAQPVLQARHSFIIEPIIQLGFVKSTSIDYLRKGVCYGVAFTGIPYILTDNLDYLNKRYAILNKYRTRIPLLIQNIDKAIHKQKTLTHKKHECKEEKTEVYQSQISIKSSEDLLTEEENLLTEIPEFCQNIYLTQSISSHRERFTGPILELLNYGQTYPFIHFSLTHSSQDKSIEIIKHIEFSGCYSVKDIEVLLSTLRTILQSEHITNPIAITYSSLRHTIVIGYHPLKNGWSHLDSGMLPIVFMKQTRVIAKRIIDGLSKNGTGIINTQIFSGNNHNMVNHCIMTWCKQDAWMQIHSITAKKSLMCDSGNRSWYEIARLNGNSSLTKELLKCSFYHRHRNLLISMTIVGIVMGMLINKPGYPAILLGALAGFAIGFDLGKGKDNAIISEAKQIASLNEKSMVLFPQEAKQPTAFKTQKGVSNYVFFRNPTFDATPKDRANTIIDIRTSPIILI